MLDIYNLFVRMIRSYYCEIVHNGNVNLLIYLLIHEFVIYLLRCRVDHLSVLIWFVLRLPLFCSYLRGRNLTPCYRYLHWLVRTFSVISFVSELTELESMSPVLSPSLSSDIIEIL